MSISNSHRRKGPRTEKTEPVGLNRVLDDADKSDEELDLEATLFGKKRKRFVTGKNGNVKGKGKGKGRDGMPGVIWDNVKPSAASDNEEDEGMSDVPDDQLFMIDAPVAATGNDEDEAGELDSEIDYEQDEEASSSDSSDSPVVPPSAQPSWLSTPSSSKPTKASLWHDPSDNQIDITMSDDKRLRKLVRGKEGPETRVDGKGLENKLREQFNKMHPEPEWANKVARKEARKRSEKGNTDPLAALFQSTASFIAPRVNRGPLPKGSLEIRRLRDANYQARTVWEGGNGKKKVDEGQGKARFADTGMTDIKFHPKVEVLAAVGADRRLRLFNIDGNTNSSLLSLHIPSLPIKSMQFHPTGSSLLLTGSRPFYYTYDLRSQRCLRSPKNLLANVSSAGESGHTASLEKTAFSPDGSVLAIAGRRGNVTLLAWGPGGSGQLLTTLKSGRTGGVQDLMWRKGGKELWVLGEGSEVDVWDLGERRCLARWKDQGGYGGRLLKGSKDGDYCAIGSTSGIVNVYDANAITSTVNQSIDNSQGLFAGATPKPIRELMNLTTEITNITFNHDSQMMALSSSKKKDAFRMFHLPSATAFTNWPTSSTPTGVVTCADFSAGSEYVAMGNTRGKILLYGLEHYKP